jgi:hypothetical protein
MITHEKYDISCIHNNDSGYWGMSLQTVLKDRCILI